MTIVARHPHTSRPTDRAAARRPLAHTLPAPGAAKFVPLAAAAGRILAAPPRAAVPLPRVDNSAMDGNTGDGQPGHLGGAHGADAIAVVPPDGRGEGPVARQRLLR